MNKHYTQIAEIIIPQHENEWESMTTLHVFDVSDEKADMIHEAAYEKSDGREYDRAAVEDYIMEDLDAHDDYNVMPGAPFHRFSAEFDYPHTVFLWDTIAYNV